MIRFGISVLVFTLFAHCLADLQCKDNEVLATNYTDTPRQYCPKSEAEAKLTSWSYPVEPKDTCICRFNYRRADNGECIPTRQCPPFECSRPNEEFNPCPAFCPTDSCIQATPDGTCPKIFGRIGIILICNPTCRCIKNYWKKDGVCVPYDQCGKGDTVTSSNTPSGGTQTTNGNTAPNDKGDGQNSASPNPTCKQNEEYSTCSNDLCRPGTCKERGQLVPCKPMAPGSCLSGCVCKEGFLKADSGECVPESQCVSSPSNQNCRQNEEYSTCFNDLCRPGTCKEKGQFVPCKPMAPGSCIGGCVCKEGFLIADSGACVPEDQCNKVNIITSSETSPDGMETKTTEKVTKDSGDDQDNTHSEDSVSKTTTIKESPDGNHKDNADDETTSTLTIRNQNKDDGDTQNKSTSKKSKVTHKSHKLKQDTEISGSNCQDEPQKSVIAEDSPCAQKNEEFRCVQSCPPQLTCKTRASAGQISCLAVVTPCSYECVCKGGYFRNDAKQCVPENECE